MVTYRNDNAVAGLYCEAESINAMAIPITSRTFGFLPNGESVEAWTLYGASGLQLEVITYGGIVTRLLVPDREGRRTDVVLGFDNLDSYLGRHPYFGAIVGRVAGRISGAHFDLDGVSYELASNDAPNHLHGGYQGFDRKTWLATPMEKAGGVNSLRLTYTSPDGEEGYPGTVNVTVDYSVTDDNVFLVEMEADADRPTPFNLTQHAYFNLGGEHCGTLDGHMLEIVADEYVPTDSRFTLGGKLAPVDGKPNDFRRSQSIKDAIPRLFGRHGDLYRLRKIPCSANETHPQSAARLTHRQSGRELEVSTTESYLQLYTGSALDGSFAGKSGSPYGAHAGLCQECHGYPDGVNTPTLGDIVLRPGKPMRAKTVIRFTTVP